MVCSYYYVLGLLVSNDNLDYSASTIASGNEPSSEYHLTQNLITYYSRYPDAIMFIWKFAYGFNPLNSISLICVLVKKITSSSLLG